MPKNDARKGKGTSILVVDDDKGILTLLRNSLEPSGYEVFTAESGEVALEQLDRHSIDLVLLDLMFPSPGMSGMEVCQEIRIVRKEEHLPIIVISSEDTEEQIVKALELGADDYVIKPFSTPELIARIKTNLRRSGSPGAVFTTGPLRVDFVQQRVQLNGHDVELTAKEYKLLEFFIRKKGRPLTKQTLLTRVWDDEYGASDHYVHVYVHNLRQVIEPDPAKPRFIITVRGVGYRFNAD